MADKHNTKLNNLFFYGVSFTDYDTVDVSRDIITNIRRRFLVTRKPASNKLYRSAKGENFVYSYNFSTERPLQWRVSRNKRVIEEIVYLLSGKYCINLYDDNGRDLKKAFFDSKHRWFKTNYYNSVSNENLTCSLVPKEFDEGTSILKYITGVVYPERLYSCSIPSCEEVRVKVLERIPTPDVTALTDKGIVYFLTDDDKENYEKVLTEEEAKYKAENAPMVYVTEEDAAAGFNLNVGDFDMSKNLNRTFDISLAEEFIPQTNTADTKISKSESESDEVPQPEVLTFVPDAEDDGSVEAAISGVVQQINARTSLDINAADILSFDVGALDNESNDEQLKGTADFVTLNNNELEIDEQLKHIDSVLDGSSLLNSERKLVIGDSVVDDDYISSIIDGIISSAFEINTADEEEVSQESPQVCEDIPDYDNEPENNTEEALCEEETTPVETLALDDEKSESEPHQDTEEQSVTVANLEDYIKANPADITIESRGEVYSYYGTVDESGKRTGRGRTLMSDGNIAYEGEYEDDKRKGQGSFYFKDGTLCYWGNWDNNVRSGFGIGVSSEDKAVHAGNWVDNKPTGLGARFDSDGNLMFISSSCEDKKKGITISDFSDTSFTVRVWSEKDDAFIQREISINDIIK